MAEIQIARRDNGDEPVVAARAEIEQTRARMSATLDEIEQVLLDKKEQVLRKKERVRERLDVLSPVRQRPLTSFGAAFGGALLLGWLSGGGDKSNHPRGDGHFGAAEYDGDSAGWQKRSKAWEGRARRLLDVARSQSAEVEELREDLEELRADVLAERRARAEDGGRASAGPTWGNRLTESFTDFIGDVLQQLARKL